MGNVNVKEVYQGKRNGVTGWEVGTKGSLDALQLRLRAAHPGTYCGARVVKLAAEGGERFLGAVVLAVDDEIVMFRRTDEIQRRITLAEFPVRVEVQFTDDYERRIRSWRVEDLLEVKGIGEKALAKMRPYLALQGKTTLAEN